MPSFQTTQPEPQQRILRMRELTKIVGLSRSTIYEKLNPESRYYDETFPKPV
ncbi:TPA: helix-turn-helix transcriptional regulator, partial [Escherichia coli]